jgi:lysophospholipase L1-like esterase
MSVIIALVTAVALIDGAAAAAPTDRCDVPDSFLSSEIDLANVTNAVKAHQRLDISVIGTGSSALSGPDGVRYAYPARLEQALQQQLQGIAIKVTAHVQSRATTAELAKGLPKILAEDKPSLVIWQTGTADAISGVAPEDFRASLDDGVAAIENGGANVILMNMQYSPRTDSMLDVSTLAEIMRIVAQQHSALLFDRLGIMRNWNDSGTFDLYTTTKNYDMARRVHDCIGRALASQIISAGHLDAMRMQTTR